MPSLAEADTVIASEASSAATIRTKRLIRFVSPSRDRDEAQFPDEWICSVVLKLISQGYSSIGYRYSRRCDAGRQRGLESFRHAVPAGMVVKKSAWQFSGKNGKEGLMTYGESWMNSPDIAEAAFARAWGVYLLIHSGIDENDARRESLQRFIRQRCEAGETDTELLAVEGLKYLKGLEGLSED
jgi:hypothetical protein